MEPGTDEEDARIKMLLMSEKRWTAQMGIDAGDLGEPKEEWAESLEAILHTSNGSTCRKLAAQTRTAAILPAKCVRGRRVRGRIKEKR